MLPGWYLRGCSLMEPFRALVDRLLLRLLNRQELSASHFEQQGGQHWLSRSALVRMAEAFERAMGERVRRYAPRDLMWMRVRAVNEFVLGRGPVWLFHPTAALPFHGRHTRSSLYAVCTNMRVRA